MYPFIIHSTEKKEKTIGAGKIYTIYNQFKQLNNPIKWVFFHRIMYTEEFVTFTTLSIE